MSNGAALIWTMVLSLGLAAALFPTFVGFDHGWHGLVPLIVSPWIH
jgi:hypothetical protein